MKISNLALSILLISSQAYASTPVSVWTNYHGNAAHTGYFDMKTNPAKIHELWRKEITTKVNLDGLKLTEPTITDQLLYLMVTTYSRLEDPDINGLYALNPETGKTVWKKLLSYDDSFTSEPVFEDGKLYWLAGYQDHYQINAIDAETGIQKLSSSINRLDSFNILTDPVAFDHHLYVGDQKGFQSSINSESGLVEWTVPAGDNQGIPTVSNDYIFRNNYPGIDVINRHTGEKFFIHITDKEKFTATTPLWDDKTKTLFAITHTFRPGESDMVAIDVEQRLVKWRLPLGSYTNAPVLAGDKLYICNFTKLYEVNTVTGKVNWTADVMKGNGAMLVTNDIVFISGFGVEKTIAVSRVTHDIVWSYNKSGTLSLDGKRLYLMSMSRSNRMKGVQIIAFSLND